MGYIKVRKANCKNCYKCLKNCISKAIMYKNEKVEIIEDRCILCGKCITACPQGAKKIDNDVSIIKEYIEEPNIKVAISVAPSFVSVFKESRKNLVWALKQLGFDYVEETAVGAKYVTREYLRLLESGEMENIISSACPSVNMYIEKYYPSLTKYIAPVMSPALVHGKMLKEKYGKDTKVVFLGSCLSMLKEVNESEYVDNMITFNQLTQWFIQERITPAEGEEMPFDAPSSYSRIYPIVDGIVYDIRHISGKTQGTDKIGGYDLVSASGLQNVQRLLDEVQKGNIKKAFLEVFSCYGGCVHGPFKVSHGSTSYRARIEVKDYADSANDTADEYVGDISATFTPKPVIEDMPTEEQIRDILSQIGKNSKAQELNCGSCGYATCRDKAIAVYQGKADLYICMPYMTDINQALSSVTLDLTPNYIVAVDNNMVIKEFNRAAQKLFGVTRLQALNKPLSHFINPVDFQQVIANQSNIYNKKVSYTEYGIITEQTIVYSEEKNMAIAIINDITREEEMKKAVHRRKLDSVEMAQKVIDKQMVVAQQIASLLGETTAETKVTLNKLKDLIDSEVD